MNLPQDGIGERPTELDDDRQWRLAPGALGVLYQNPDPGVLTPRYPAYCALQFLFRERRKHCRAGPTWARDAVRRRPAQEFVRGL